MPELSVVRAVRSSSVAELAWLEGDGSPQVRGVVPLVRGERPVVAFTYADEPTARRAAAAPGLVLALTEARSTGPGFAPRLLRGRPRLVEDPEGTVFGDDLLVEELRRYPPSRLLADSPMLCREHWWYLPRLLIELDVDAIEPLPVRRQPTSTALGDHVLVTGSQGQAPAASAGETPDVQVVSVDQDGPPDLLSVQARDEADGVGQEQAVAGPAVLFGQDASFPDLEQWSQWQWHGVWQAGRLDIRQAPEQVGLEPVPSVWGRWRRQRDLERRCRAALAGRS